MMGLFKKDLYRAFSMGFVLGAAALGLSMGGDARAAIIETIADVSPL